MRVRRNRHQTDIFNSGYFVIITSVTDGPVIQAPFKPLGWMLFYVDNPPIRQRGRQGFNHQNLVNKYVAQRRAGAFGLVMQGSVNVLLRKIWFDRYAVILLSYISFQ